MSEGAIRIDKLEEITGLSRTTIFNRMNPSSKYYDPTFPKRISLGGRSVGWRIEDVNEWLRNRNFVATTTVSKMERGSSPQVPPVPKTRQRQPAAATRQISTQAESIPAAVSLATQDPTALLSHLTSALQQTEYIKNCLCMKTWTPAMGALLASGIKAPIGCTTIPKYAEGIDGEQLEANSSRLRRARSILKDWINQDNNVDDDDIEIDDYDARSSTTSLPNAITPFEFFFWCDDERIDTDWLRLMKEISGNPVPDGLRHMPIIALGHVSPPKYPPEKLSTENHKSPETPNEVTPPRSEVDEVKPTD